MSLKIENLTFKLNPEGPYFFKDLNLELADGQLGFIKGANGIGKSTLFRAMAGKLGLSEECSGKITLDQTIFDLAQDRDQIMEKIISMPQKYNEILAPSFTFDQNLALSQISKLPSLKVFKSDKVDHEVVQKLQINHNLPVHYLSEGQKQILAIKIMLLKNPQVLLLDEPTATLDEANAHLTFGFLKELAHKLKMNILIICHQMHLIEQYADATFELELSRNPTIDGLIQLKKIG